MITESVVTSTRLSPVSIVTSVQEMSMFGARRRRLMKAAHMAKRGRSGGRFPTEVCDQLDSLMPETRNHQ